MKPNLPACVCGITLLTLVSRAVAQPSPPLDSIGRVAPPYGRVVALCVGIKTYPRNSLGLRNIPVAEGNAKAVAKFFRNRYGYDIKEIIDPSKTEILQRLEELSSLGENDVAVIYICGHGARIRISGKDEKAYLIPHLSEVAAGKLPGLDASQDPAGRVAVSESCIEYADIANKVARLNLKHALLILDGCYAGAADQGESPAPLTKPADCDDRWCWPSRQMLASSFEDQLSRFVEGQQSFFTASLLNVLSKSAVISMDMAAATVGWDVHKTTGGKQTPIRQALRPSSGDFLFIAVSVKDWHQELENPPAAAPIGALGPSSPGDILIVRASAGDGDAMAQLYRTYSRPGSPEHDDKQAFRWAVEAHATQTRSGAAALADAYERGVGTARDPERARALRQQAGMVVAVSNRQTDHAAQTGSNIGGALFGVFGKVGGYLIGRSHGEKNSAAGELRNLSDQISKAETLIRQDILGFQLKTRLAAIQDAATKLRKDHSDKLDSVFLDRLPALLAAVDAVEDIRKYGLRQETRKRFARVSSFQKEIEIVIKE